MRFSSSALLLLSALCTAAAGVTFPGPAHAATATDLIGARRVGLAGAGRALAIGEDGAYLNPAGLLTQPRYMLSFQYLNAPHRDGQLANATIMDSQTNPAIGGGVSYTYFDFSDMGLREDDGRGLSAVGHRLDLATAYRIAGSWIMGSTFRYLKAESRNGDNKSTVNFDLGLIWQISETLSLGYVAENFRYEASEFTPFRQSFGLGWRPTPTLMLVTDAVMELPDADEDPEWRYALGTEFLLGEYIQLRGGYAFDTRENQDQDLAHEISAGISALAPRMAIDLGYRHRLANSSDYTLVLGVRIMMGE